LLHSAPSRRRVCLANAALVALVDDFRRFTVSFLIVVVLLVGLGGWLDSRLNWPRPARAQSS
jgi:hypothetical protein